ncbi:MAG: maltotransferase domain-containing protein, partial [Nocardioides sp.]
MVGRIPVMDVSPLVDLGRLPAKAAAGESVPVRATVFREGHDRLGAEVVLVAPDGSRRAPVRMVPDGDAPDRYVAWVAPDTEGAWSFEVHAWSDPLATWEHAAGLKIPAGVDVELMFTEGGMLLDRVAGDSDLDSHEQEIV